jgi:hypothetical protein
MRRTTAATMARSWQVIPHVTQFDRADVTELEALRRRLGERAAAASGAKLTLTAIVLKVAASALRTFPKFGASLDMAREEVVYKQYVHIGVAVDTEHGLTVPVVPRRRPEEPPPDCGGDRVAVGSRAATEARPRGSLGRELHRDQPRRPRNDVLLAHHPLAGGGRARRRPRRDRGRPRGRRLPARASSCPSPSPTITASSTAPTLPASSAGSRKRWSNPSFSRSRALAR